MNQIKLNEKYIEMNCQVWNVFIHVDFDIRDYELLWSIYTRFDLPKKYVGLIKVLYTKDAEGFFEHVWRLCIW